MESILNRIRTSKMVPNKKGVPNWSSTVYVHEDGDAFIGNPNLVVRFIGTGEKGVAHNLDLTGKKMDFIDPTARVIYMQVASELGGKTPMFSARFEKDRLLDAVNICQAVSKLPPMLYQHGSNTSLHVVDQSRGARVAVDIPNQEVPTDLGKEYFTYLNHEVTQIFLQLIDEPDVAIRFFEKPLPYLGGTKNIRVLFSYSHTHVDFI